MKRANPAITWREWLVAPAYEQAREGDTTLIKELQQVFSTPYQAPPAEAGPLRPAQAARVLQRRRGVALQLLVVSGRPMASKRTLGVVLFEGFELLDVFGPLEMFGLAADHFEIRLISESGGVVASRQGPKSVCDDSFQSAPAIDVLLVPGGIGTRREVNNPVLLNWLKERSQQAELVASVCTGSALLAKAGVLDGLRATSNKLAFAWAASQSEKVQWQQQARWVEDGKVFSSSGVSAGIDMSLAVIAKLVSQQAAEDAANFAEYTWQRDADCDPFASVVGVSESA